MKVKRQTTESKIMEIAQTIRKKYSEEEKIRIVMEGILCETTISGFCSLKGISANQYYKWRKFFIEVDKEKFVQNIKLEAMTSEVHHVKIENLYLLQLIAELSNENRKLKKRLNGDRMIP
jgi:transposase